MGNWEHGGCGGNRSLVPDLVISSHSLLALALSFVLFSPSFFTLCSFLWRVSVCCVLITSIQSGTGGKHMRCMYVGIACICNTGCWLARQHPQTAKLRYTRKKISLALPIARPPPSGRIGLRPSAGPRSASCECEQLAALPSRASTEQIN